MCAGFYGGNILKVFFVNLNSTTATLKDFVCLSIEMKHFFGWHVISAFSFAKISLAHFLQLLLNVILEDFHLYNLGQTWTRKVC